MRLTEEMSEQRKNKKRMNKHNYHRRVKEAGSTQTIITINAPDPDQSWPECFWKCSFPVDLSKHNTRARYRGFIAHVKVLEKKNLAVSDENQELQDSACNLVLLSKINTCSPSGQK